jgi:hypothetical protein
MNDIFVAAININTVIMIIVNGVAKAAIPLFLEENPPVDRVEKEWQTASNTGTPEIISKIASAKVKRK